METLRKLERAALLLRERGLSGMASIVGERIRRLTGRLDPHEAEWSRRKLLTDAGFDRPGGFDTGGVQRLYDLSIVGDNARHGVNHIASDPDDFGRAIGAIDADLSRFTFVDLGSGKGRALILAARFPFKRIIGVEFALELHTIAAVNADRLTPRDRDRMQLVHGDASRFQIPDGPLLLYLYHPFEAGLMTRVAERHMSDWRARPRQVFVVYVNPQHGDAWQAAGWRKAAFGQSFMIFEPPAGKTEPVKLGARAVTAPREAMS